MTGQMLVRVIDEQEDQDSYQMAWTTSVSNRAEAQRILKDVVVAPAPGTPRNNRRQMTWHHDGTCRVAGAITLI